MFEIKNEPLAFNCPQPLGLNEPHSSGCHEKMELPRMDQGI
jgi:hypothetical protein